MKDKLYPGEFEEMEHHGRTDALVERPKWIWEHDEHYGTDIKTCSECGASYQHFDFTNYCPNCGKRMNK